MRKGELCRLRVAPKYGYGERGGCGVYTPVRGWGMWTEEGVGVGVVRLYGAGAVLARSKQQSGLGDGSRRAPCLVLAHQLAWYQALF